MDKKLYKSRENRVICGVCGGIGEYFNIDPTVIRLLCLRLGKRAAVLYCCGSDYAG